MNENEKNTNNMDSENISPKIAALIKKDEAESKAPKIKRDVIKNVLIIFLALMLVLTFFSNTIMNRSLAEISTESVSYGKLTERVRGSGLVESNQAYEVKVEGNKVVDTICVKVGQEVEKDKVLFTIGTGESTELTEAQTMLDALELEYQKSLLVTPTDYSAENQAIKNAQEDLNAAIAKRNTATANQGSVQTALNNYNQNKATLEQKTAAQTKLQSTITAIDMDDYAAAAVEYTGNLVSLFNTYSAAETAYNEVFALYSQLMTEGADVTAAKAESDAKAAVRDTAKAAYDNEKINVRAELVNQMSAIESEISSISAEITAYENQQLNGTGTATLEELNADVQAKQRILEDLVIALEKTKKEGTITSQITNLDTEAKKAEIDKQKEKVEKLKAECETTEIKSKYAGIVSAINIKPGEETVPDMPIAVIDIAEEGYTVKISVDGEKAKKVKTGAEAEVVNSWGGNIQAVLSEIKNDTVSGSKNKILTFSVTGSVDSGSNLDLSIPCGSSTYDAIVPKSAIYEDKNGKFVLTVRSKSSPLGNRYYAERVEVEVIASDETSSAVSGMISAGDYVITASSKPVSPNDQVRMKD